MTGLRRASSPAVWALALLAALGLAACAPPAPHLSIWEAAAAGDVEELAANLAAGADPNEAASNGEPPLHYAAASGQPRAVVALLNAGADVNEPDVRYGCTALSAAAAKGDVEMARLLIDAGARLTPIEGRYGYAPSPLHTAAQRGDLPMVRLLVEAGAPLDLVSVEPGDFDGHTRGTPREFAERAGQREAAAWLKAREDRP